MPSPRLMAVITALLMISGPRGALAEYTVEQLQELERLIVGQNCGQLYTYVIANPGLLNGSDPLAAELRDFVENVEGGFIDCFAARPASPFDFLFGQNPRTY